MPNCPPAGVGPNVRSTEAQQASGGFLVARWSAPLTLGELNIRGGYVPPLPDRCWLIRRGMTFSLCLHDRPMVGHWIWRSRRAGEHDLPDVGLTLEALEPHRRYGGVTNRSGDSIREVAEFIADADGRAVTSIAVTGFTKLRVETTDSGKA